MWLTKLSIDRPAFITMVILAMIVFGAVSMTRLGVDLYPAVNFPNVSINVTYPGVSPQDMETLVSRPIEEAVSSIDNVDHITSSSREGVSMVNVRFALEADGNTAANEVQRKVNSIRNRLPEDIEPPNIVKSDPNASPIIQLAVSSSVRSVPDLYYICKEEISDRLAQVGGVASVTLTGEREREIRVEVNTEKLEAMALPIQAISDALGKANLNLPSGRLNKGDREVGVRVDGEFKAAGEVGDVKLPVPDSSSPPVLLKDIATIRDTYKEQRVFSRFNRNNCIGVYILKTTDANSVKVSDDVEKVLAGLRRRLPPDVRINVASNQTNYTRDSLREVQHNLVEGILLTGLIILFFLHSFRNTAIVMLSIPTCIITTFCFMLAAGYTMNTMSLIGLALAIGILVDDSIVVLENIHRHLELGEKPKEAAYSGRSEIGFAAIAITLVDVVVFAPIAFLSGVRGMLFRQFALVVVCSTLLSLFVSFTLTPMLASRWSKARERKEGGAHLNPVYRLFERLYSALRSFYAGMALPFCLRHRPLVLLVSFGCLLASLSLLPLNLIGVEFIGQADRGEFTLDARLPIGTSVQRTNETAARMEEFILSQPSVESVLTVAGTASGRMNFTRSANVFQCQVKLKKGKGRTKSTNAVIRDITTFARKLPGLDMRPLIAGGLLGTSNRPPLEINIRGREMPVIKDIAERTYEIVRSTKGTRGVRSSYEEGNPEIGVRVDKEKAAHYGLTITDVATALRTNIDGNVATRLRWGDEEIDVRVMLPENRRASERDLLEIPIMARSGEYLRLHQVATLRESSGPNQIDRYDKLRSISVTGSLTAGATLGPVMQEIRGKLKSLVIPPSVDFAEGGEVEQMSQSIGELALALCLSVLLIYMLMVALFESYLYPFIIMFSVPVAVTGALSALALTGKTLNIFSMIGLIMLMGLVAKNAILIVDYCNTLREKGLPLHEALIEAGSTRLRPILMTTSAMISGMLPLALAVGQGSEVRSGMGVVVIGGLISSLTFTLVLVPVVYTYMNDFLSWLRRGKESDAPPGHEGGSAATAP